MTLAERMQQWPLQTAAVAFPGLIGLLLDAPLIGVLKRWPNTLHAVDDQAIMAGVHRNTVATQLKALVGTKVDYRHRSGRSAEYRLIRRTDATQPDLHKDPIVQVPDDLPDPW